MRTEANDQAFPLNFPDQEYFEGLTKREYFAAQAMAGILARGSFVPSFVARHAVAYADALIQELNKQDDQEFSDLIEQAKKLDKQEIEETIRKMQKEEVSNESL